MRGIHHIERYIIKNENTPTIPARALLRLECVKEWERLEDDDESLTSMHFPSLDVSDPYVPSQRSWHWPPDNFDNRRDPIHRRYVLHCLEAALFVSAGVSDKNRVGFPLALLTSTLSLYLSPQ